MISAWRIVKEKYRKQAVAGEGSEINGGRWNNPGVPVVYAADTISLAMLEMIVHFSNPNPPTKYVIIGMHFDENLVEIPGALPPRWNRYPHSKEARNFGDQWAIQKRSVVLRVPSAIVPSQWNYMLNPCHPQFKKVVIDLPESISLDIRLIKGARSL